MDSRAFHEALADHAIQFRASVERDDMVISVVTLSENAPLAMHLVQMALTHPRFDAEAVNRVRAQMIQGIQEGNTRPGTVARRAFSKAFFNGHPYGRPSDGEVGTLSAITVEDLRGFAKTHWVKGDLKVAVAGDITAEAAQKLLGETLQPLSSVTPPPLPNIGRLGSPGVHVLPLPVPQPTILFGLPGIMRADPDFIPGYVANYILGGGGFSSRLTDEVRVKRGLTYGISTGLTSYRKASVMIGSVATRADAVRQTIQVVRDTLGGFRHQWRHPERVGRRQDFPDRLLPAGLRFQCRDRLPAGHFPAPGPGYRLCRQAQRPDSGRHPGRCEASGETFVRSGAFDGGGGGHPGGRQVRAAKSQTAGPAHAAGGGSDAGVRCAQCRPASARHDAEPGGRRQTGGKA